MPITAQTSGPQSASLSAGVVKSIVPANPQRSGLIICNSLTLGVILIGVGAAPTANQYTWRLDPGEDWALPMYGAYQDVYALCASAISLGNGLSFTEFFVP